MCVWKEVSKSNMQLLTVLGILCVCCGGLHAKRTHSITKMIMTLRLLTPYCLLIFLQRSFLSPHHRRLRVHFFFSFIMAYVFNRTPDLINSRK